MLNVVILQFYTIPYKQYHCSPERFQHKPEVKSVYICTSTTEACPYTKIWGYKNSKSCKSNKDSGLPLK